MGVQDLEFMVFVLGKGAMAKGHGQRDNNATVALRVQVPKY